MVSRSHSGWDKRAYEAGLGPPPPLTSVDDLVPFQVPNAIEDPTANFTRVDVPSGTHDQNF